MMMEIVFKARVRGRIRAAWLGLTLSVIVAQLGHAQTMPPVSVIANQANPLTALPGQNVAQQMMGSPSTFFARPLVR
jgi:hypothetical protein